MKKLGLTKDALPQNLPLFLSFAEIICSHADVPAPQCGDIKLAIEEACSNIITHAYAGQPPGIITLSGYKEKDTLVIHISDKGIPFNPDDAPPPDLDAQWQDRKVGGLGWHLIRKIVDKISYEAVSGENRLTLVIQMREG